MTRSNTPRATDKPRPTTDDTYLEDFERTARMFAFRRRDKDRIPVIEDDPEGAA